MTLSIATSLLVVVVLGQRFKVMVLVPAIVPALVLTVAAGIARADATWLIIATSIAVVTSLQVGYLLGTGIRHLIAAARANRPRTGSLAASMPVRHPAH